MIAFGNQLENDSAKMIKLMEMQEAFATDQMLYTTARLGFQGQHWEYNDVMQAEYIGGPRNYDTLMSIGAHMLVCKPAGPDMQTWLDGPNTMVWLEENGFLTDGYMSQIFSPIPSSATYMTELDKIWNETRIGIITGELPLDAFDDYVARWHSNGGDILRQEAQNIFDSY
jgi:putative aldouronate transport system substrate-binding protein